jgi:hypothetical protein
MASFQGTVWDPVLRRWVEPTPDVVERRANYRVRKRPIEICSLIDAAPPITRSKNLRPRWTAGEVIQNLTDAQEQMARWHGKSSEDNAVTREMFRADYGMYEKAVGRAIRAGMRNLPIVAAWISGRRSIGDKQALRRLRLGLEAGMEREIDAADCWIAIQASDLIVRMSLEAVRRRVLKKIATAPIEIRASIARRLHSKQTLQKRLAGLGINSRGYK